MSKNIQVPFGAPSDGFIKATSGNKVGWLHYETKEQAEAAIPIIAQRRDRALERGYDFGYLWPTDIHQDANGHWVIVTP